MKLETESRIGSQVSTLVQNYDSGISETERIRRKESNLFTTKINFIAWLLEVCITTYKKSGVPDQFP